jgi:hypothetical protein
MKNESILNKKLSKTTVGELLQLLHPTQKNEERTIRGINGLAIFLQSTPSTAQKIKNSGKIPFKQYGRVLIFKESDIMAYQKRK